MTEGSGRRRYWRRGSRKKAAPEGGLGGPEPAPAPEGQEDAGDSGEPGAAPGVRDEPAAAAEESEPEREPTGEAPVAGDDAAAPQKRSRRRGRRRRKPPAGAAAAGEAAGSSAATEPAVTGEEFPEPAVSGPAPEGAAEGEAGGVVSEDRVVAAAPEQGLPSAEPGRRRRRRRRRRGKGRAQIPPGAGELSSTGEEASGEGTAEALGEIEEGVPSVGLTEAEEGELAGGEAGGAEGAGEEFEEEAEVQAGGARRVMLIDGLHAEEQRVAIVSDGALDYFEVENQRKKAFKGNIYKGKVVNIAHAIEAAFVEFGGGRHGFLPLNEYCAGALMDHLGTWNEGDKRPPLRPGMEILVQVTKEESSIKGAALTSYISIAGRYMVMMLGMKRYGISKKITGEKERERIRKQMEKLEYPEHLGFIVRTVGAARPLKDLKADLQNLLKLWERTVDGARANKAPALLYEEQDIVIRTLRDNYSADVSEVMLNSEAAYRKASAFFDVYYPKQKGKLKLYRQKRPLFARFNLEEQVEKVTARKVPLASGGHIVIDHTEAIWTIDVNSGRSSKDRDIEDTAYRTNREAAAEVTRQMRLRDIGGLIIVDFIDMESKAHNKEVERILKDGLKKDKAKSDFTSLGKFGLVAISRQRMGTSFYDVLTKGCEVCGGIGVVATRDAVVVRLLRHLHDELSKEGKKELTVRVAPGLLETLLNQKREEITRVERLCGAKVVFQVDATLPPSGFSLGNDAGR